MNKKFTKWMAAALLLLLITPPMWVWGQTRTSQTASYGFETGDAGWTATSFVTNNTAITAHGGSKYGATNSSSTADVQYNSIVESPLSLTCYYSKASTNTNAGSKFHIQVSSNNSTWTTVASGLGMDQVTKGTWYELTADLSSYSNVYVRIHYDGTSAVRALDDITLTYLVSGTCTVTYDCNGGESGCPTNVSDIEPGTSITLAAAPTKPHYNFIGWKNGETTYNAGEPYTVNSNVTFTAQWESDGTLGEGSICFSSQSSCTAINSTSVTGEDNLDNTWTITTVGTNSFTSNSGYYQVGSGNYPATSITFTTTLPEEVNVTDFSATFGGFSATRATITIKVDNTTVGTGSLNGGSDVTVSSSSAQIGTTLTVIVTPTAGGVKCYNISYAYETIDNPTVATTTTINVPQNFNNNIYQSTTAGTLTATVTENVGNTSISGATVTWESSDTGVATIDANGAVTLVAVGTTTITASYAGAENEYRPSSATYELTVINSAPSISFNGSSANIGTYPTGEEITLDGIIVSQNSLTENISLSANKGTVTPQIINAGAEPTEIVWKYTPTEAGYTTATITATSGDVEATYEIQFVAKTPHDITIASGITHGTITSNKATAIENENVDLTVTPAGGYELDILTIMAGETPIVPTIEDKPTYRFQMPNSNVTVSATFKEVADYATLPFEWDGGTSGDLTALTGVTGNSLSDYAAGNAPYIIKFDGTGDYIQIKTNSRPEQVTIGVKMIGGATTSKITVKASTDGTTFDDGEELTISGSQNDVVNLETTRTFGSDVRYVRMVFTKGSNVGVGPISITKYVPKYAVNLNQPQQGQGTIAADKAEAAEGETVTLTATPNTGYAFESWTVLDGEANEVTVTNDQFTMPASAVEVEANFNELQKHNIVIADAIEENVIVDAEENKAYAGETVTISVEAPTGKVLATLTVTGNISSNIMTIDPAVSPYVDDYTFTMPDEDVTINATFDNAPSFIVTFSVNGSVDDNLEVSVTQGQSTALPTSSTLTPSGFSITGWAASEGSLVAVANPYTPTAGITLYAILGQTIPHSLVINASTPNFPSSYGTANTFTEYNLGGKNFMIQQGYINGGKLQWRASGNSNGTGTMYNSEDLGKINTIILVYDSSDNNKNFTIKAGTTENPTEGTSIEPSSTNGLVYTFDLSSGNYNYFVMTNGTNAGYLQSISIDFVADLNINTVVEYATTTSLDENIATNECVIVKNGAVLTFTGENQGTADNLIIEDGGQLIVNTSGVQATVKKAIAAPAKAADHWYTISSPVNNIGITSVTNLVLDAPAVYDLYRYNEPTHMWENYKNATAHADFTNLTNGRGYLYYNSTGDDLAFSGELNASNVEISLTANSDKLTGFNLIGNPYSHDVYKGDGTAIVNSVANGYELATGFYTLTDQSAWEAGTDNSTVIKSGQGFLVQATTAGTLTITNTNAQGNSAKANNEMIQFTVANGQYKDVAYALFDEAIGLNKIEHINPEVPLLYIAQNGQDYAIATMERSTTAFDLNLNVATAGEYTLSAKALGSYDYLHLFDRMTGIDIDLLATDKYTFNSKPRDYMYRFEVRLSENASTGSATDETFAFFANGNLIVNNEGEATLQVIDMTGRVLRSEAINGSANIGTKGLATGVYVLRLVNGNNIKTQKMVLK